jgi:ATPase subunit of ABC transporter with duplicated ATPase domains
MALLDPEPTNHLSIKCRQNLLDSP